MKPEIKARWVAALRSGKYTQGMETLRRSATPTTVMTHCCLGVLCDIHSEGSGIEWDMTYGSNTYYGKEDLLPEAVMSWAGLSEQDPVLVIGTYTNTASFHNDGVFADSIPFIELADAIEAQL